MTQRAGRGFPTWKRPAPYGLPEAVYSAGMMVAPLLAGFSLTLIVLILDSTAASDAAPGSEQAIRHPELTLLLLIVATVLLLAAVQCAYWARQYSTDPAAVEDWWGGLDDVTDPYVRRDWERARQEQFGFARLERLWINRFRRVYHLGVLVLLAAMTTVLIPSGTITATRWLALAVAATAALAELAWILSATFAARLSRTATTDRPHSSLTRLTARVIERLHPTLDLVDPRDLSKGIPPASLTPRGADDGRQPSESPSTAPAEPRAAATHRHRSGEGPDRGSSDRP